MQDSPFGPRYYRLVQVHQVDLRHIRHPAVLPGDAPGIQYRILPAQCSYRYTACASELTRLVIGIKISLPEPSLDGLTETLISLLSPLSITHLKISLWWSYTNICSASRNPFGHYFQQMDHLAFAKRIKDCIPSLRYLLFDIHGHETYYFRAMEAEGDCRSLEWLPKDIGEEIKRKEGI
ncbi:hypothetical protein AcV5_009102 [Taiwanofungus camphoratus]|nr:hypothetical protein AcV5_009102 [Antrodia cinnamomea]